MSGGGRKYCNTDEWVLGKEADAFYSVLGLTVALLAKCETMP